MSEKRGDNLPAADEPNADDMARWLDNRLKAYFQSRLESLFVAHYSDTPDRPWEWPS